MITKPGNLIQTLSECLSAADTTLDLPRGCVGEHRGRVRGRAKVHIGKLDLQVQDLFGRMVAKRWKVVGGWWCRWCRAREMPGRTHSGGPARHYCRGLDDDIGNPSRSICFYSYRLPKTLLAIQAHPLAKACVTLSRLVMGQVLGTPTLPTLHDITASLPLESRCG